MMNTGSLSATPGISTCPYLRSRAIDFPPCSSDCHDERLSMKSLCVDHDAVLGLRYRHLWFDAILTHCVLLQHLENLSAKTFHAAPPLNHALLLSLAFAFACLTMYLATFMSASHN